MKALNIVKTGLMSLFILLAVSMFVMLPVSASTDLTIDGTVAPVFGLTCVPTEMHMQNMAIGDNELTSGTPTVTVTGNTPSWEVKIVDRVPYIESYGTPIFPPNSGGHMKYYLSGSPNGKVLHNALQAKLTGGSYAPIGATDTVLMSSAIAGSGPAYTGTFSFKQTVTGDDVPYTSGAYVLLTTVSGGATA